MKFSIFYHAVALGGCGLTTGASPQTPVYDPGTSSTNIFAANSTVETVGGGDST